MSKFFEIFRAGTHTDNNGRRITISADDLAATAAAYNTTTHEAPVVVGHPKTDAPAYGWVGSLKAEGGSLLADFAQMDAAFAEQVRQGRYKKVSASFYQPDAPANPAPGKWSLRHVGFLGAHPPAIKGLKPIEFNEAEAGVVEFGERAEPATLLRRLLAALGFQAADFAEDAPLPAPQPDPESPPEPPQPKEPDMATEEQLAAEKAAREQAEQAAAAAQAELQKLKDAQAQSEREAAHQENTDFAEGLVKAGRLKPADKDLVVQALDFAEYPQHTTADFGEGDGKKPLSAALRDFLGAVLPKQLPAAGHLATGAPAKPAGVSAEFAEHADPEAVSHHQRALALAAKEGISYAEAARRTVA